MMKIKYPYITFLFIIFLIVNNSCQKDFRYNIKNSNLISVSCLLKANDTIRLYLSKVVTSYGEHIWVNNAEIFLIEDNNIVTKLDKVSEDGLYSSNMFFPHEGKHYSIKVKVLGFDTIYAQTDVPMAVKIDSLLYTENSEASEFADVLIKLKINLLFSDPVNSKNYYFVDPFLEMNDPIISPKDKNGFVDGNYFYSPYFSDSLINGENHSINFSDSYGYYEGYSPDTIIFTYELKSVSKELYYYNKTLALAFLQKNNHLTEPIVIYSNIKNGTGIFAGMSLDVDSIVVYQN